MPVQQMRFDLPSLIELGRNHWREYLPKKYRQLQQMHQLEPSLRAAAQMTLKEMEDDRAVGYSQYEAWEKDREHFLLLPEEYDPQANQLPDSPAYNALAEKNKALQSQE